MTEPGPSSRFRAAALTMLAAGGVVLLIVLLAAGSFGLLPTPATRGADEPDTTNDPALLATYGASGVVPRNTELPVGSVAALTSGITARAEARAGIPEGDLEIPDQALDAYRRGELALALEQPDCHLSWTLLAGLGQVISGHAAGGLDTAGNTLDPLVGPRLDGSDGLARIVDTDQGRLDGDPEWDRAVGPMQIIPTVWSRVTASPHPQQWASPHNIQDAALAAGRYLCEGGADLREITEQAYSVFRYQRSEMFVQAVLAWSAAYGERLAEPGNPDDSDESREPEADDPAPEVVTTTQAPPPRREPRMPPPSPTSRAPSPSRTSVVVTTTPSPPPTDSTDPAESDVPSAPAGSGDRVVPPAPSESTGPA